MTDRIDLDAYFRRIGHTGPREPTFDTLRALIQHHTEAIPFENIDPLLRRPVRLDAARLEQKLVKGGRGGYCFEHNLLFQHVLRELGFNATGLAARVLWNRSEDEITARGHMLLRVDLDGEVYLADVGFGGQTLTGPLRLVMDEEQITPHEPFRVIRVGDDFIMQTSIRDDWKALYRFDLQEQFLPDYEVTSWYLSNHPESHFVNRLIVARAASDRRYTLSNNELSIHHLGGSTERTVLHTVEDVREVLEDLFLLNLSEPLDLDSALERIMVKDPQAA